MNRTVRPPRNTGSTSGLPGSRSSTNSRYSVLKLGGPAKMVPWVRLRRSCSPLNAVSPPNEPRLSPRTTYMATAPRPQRGEIWTVRFDPSVGAEIRKSRPAVVCSVDSIGRLPLRVVVPLTDWQPSFERLPCRPRHVGSDGRNCLGNRPVRGGAVIAGRAINVVQQVHSPRSSYPSGGLVLSSDSSIGSSNTMSLSTPRLCPIRGSVDSHMTSISTGSIVSGSTQ